MIGHNLDKSQRVLQEIAGKWGRRLFDLSVSFVTAVVFLYLILLGKNIPEMVGNHRVDCVFMEGKWEAEEMWLALSVQCSAPLESGVELVVIGDLFFAIAPAEIDVTAVNLGKKINQASFQVFDNTAIGPDLVKQILYDHEILRQRGGDRSTEVKVAFGEQRLQLAAGTDCLGAHFKKPAH